MSRPVALPLVALAAAGAFLLPAPPETRAGLFLLLLAGGLWLSEALPLVVTALLVPLLAVALGLLEVKDALAPFANPVIALFFGGFALASALRRHGLDRLLATQVVRATRGRFLPAALALIAGTAFISMWVSNTATAAMMLPLALGLLAGADRERDRNSIAFVLLGIAYAASIGGMGTLVGSPPNALAAAEAGWTFRDWLGIGLPLVGLLLPLAVLVLWLVFRPHAIPLAAAAGGEAFRWSRGTLATVAIFALTVTLWLAGDTLGKALGIAKDFDALVAVGAAVLLLATRTLAWKDLERDTDWGVLLLFGGGLCLSAVLKSSGASDWLAENLLARIGDLPLPLLMLLLATFIVFLSELASNTAATALLLPLFMPLAGMHGLDPGLLAAFIALSASCGFMLPVATPPNAIVFGTGAVRQRDMVRAGLALNFACIAVLVLWFAP